MSETLRPALPAGLDRDAEALMRRLCESKLKVATAESCTGGMLASLLTDIEGAGRETVLREEHFGANSRGPVRIESLGGLLEMLKSALPASEDHTNGRP